MLAAVRFSPVPPAFSCQGDVPFCQRFYRAWVVVITAVTVGGMSGIAFKNLLLMEDVLLQKL